MAHPSSRYEEEKRVVHAKDAGPLISMKEMSRCIHCTRCVRFGQEIAGVMEFGMLNRGEHSEITTFVNKTVDSELSGNMIDLCPVGALTSKPFRYSARTWELSRRKSVSPHDSLGANLVVQVKGAQVMRVLPLENDAINECWLSDRDRFAYEGLNSADRLTSPMIKQDGQWQTTDWQTALEYVAHGLRNIRHEHSARFHRSARDTVFDVGRVIAIAETGSWTWDQRMLISVCVNPMLLAIVRLRRGWE
jgi:NADH-quinone oxidoreductase subunit G